MIVVTWIRDKHFIAKNWFHKTSSNISFELWIERRFFKIKPKRLQQFPCMKKTLTSRARDSLRNERYLNRSSSVHVTTSFDISAQTGFRLRERFRLGQGCPFRFIVFLSFSLSLSLDLLPHSFHFSTKFFPAIFEPLLDSVQVTDHSLKKWRLDKWISKWQT